MVHVRIAGPPKNVPARNHTGPRCPTMQSAPVASRSGLTVVGIEVITCHHSADSPDNGPISAKAVLAPNTSPTNSSPTVTVLLILMSVLLSCETEMCGPL